MHLLPHEIKSNQLEKFLLWIIVCIFSAVATVAYCDATNDVDDYIAWWHKNVNKRRLKRALTYTPLIIESTNKHDIDPLLVATVISFESSWHPKSKGKLGEIGLMQVMPNGICAHGQDLTTAAGQIEAGVNCLSICKKNCGPDIKKILTFYGTGKGCTSKNKRTNSRINMRVAHYRAAVKRHRSN